MTAFYNQQCGDNLRRHATMGDLNGSTISEPGPGTAPRRDTCRSHEYKLRLDSHPVACENSTILDSPLFLFDHRTLQY